MPFRSVTESKATAPHVGIKIEIEIDSIAIVIAITATAIAAVIRETIIGVAGIFEFELSLSSAGNRYRGYKRLLCP